MKSKIANAVLTTFGILLLICSITFTVFAYVGQVPFLPAKNNIVANAQVEIQGETYVDIPLNTYTLVATEISNFGSNYHYVEFFSFVPQNETLYCITLNFNDGVGDYMLYSYYYPTNSYDEQYLAMSDIVCDCVGGSAFIPILGSSMDYNSYPYNILYDYLNEEFWLVLRDDIGSFLSGIIFEVNVYEVPTNNTESTTTESLTNILGNSINFSTSAITTSVKEVFEGLFVNENNTISNYATYVVWFSGIAIALGFFKYILRFILTMGDKK